MPEEGKIYFYKVLLYLGSKLSEKDVFLEQQKLIIRQKEGVDTNSIYEFPWL